VATPEITIYTTMFCPYCLGAKRLLDEKGVPFHEIKVDGDRAGRAAMTERAGGLTSVPQIFIGDEHVGGCTELYALEEAGKLDTMLKGEAA
jgi:glutaredoxin 3